MMKKSLELIHDVVINSGKISSIEISQGSIYLDFRDVELGTPKFDDDFFLTVRFASESFITVFYNNIWDVDFLSNYNFNHQYLSEEIDFKVKDIHFIDFECLNKIFYNYEKDKTISNVEDFDIHNIRNDFFMLVETKEIAIVMGGNQMDFFSPFEKLNDNSLKELSNQWMLYFLNYRMKRNIIKNPICENHPLRYMD